MVVRLTEEDYAKMNDFCERGKLSKEAFWIKIVKGKPMQVAPPQIYRELILLLRETGNGLNSPKNYFDIARLLLLPLSRKQ